MAPHSVSIYAELLFNIRQVSLAISLPSPADQSTKITVTHAKASSVVHVQHGSETASLVLPGLIACPEGRELTVDRRQADAKTLSWRLPLAGGAGGDGAVVAGVMRGVEVAAPWEARDLVPGGEVLCRACRAPLVRGGAVRAWKDLPAEGWAEMMEFWHCHKPGEGRHGGHGHGHADGAGEGEDGKADEKSLASRGYGAASAISAQKGVGFVDLTTLLFDEGDCDGVVFSFSSFSQGSTSRDDLKDTVSAASNLNIFCKKCETRVGFFNHKTAAVTLFKWHILCQTQPSSSSRPPPTAPECLAATLSATLSRTASSKSVLLPLAGLAPLDSTPTPVLHFWILNPALSYASTHATESGPVSAMKLLYRKISRDEADKMLEDVNSDVQEVNLPEEATRAVVLALDETNGLLPAAERMFGEWTIGMLRRCEV